MDRDLKTSPFEETAKTASESARQIREDMDGDLAEAVAGLTDGFAAQFSWADGQWKRRNWPPPPEEHVESTFTFFELVLPFETLRKSADAESKEERERVHKHSRKLDEQLEDLRRAWGGWPREKRLEWAERKRHLLHPRAPAELSQTGQKEAT